MPGDNCFQIVVSCMVLRVVSLSCFLIATFLYFCFFERSMNEEYIPDGVDESGNFVQYSLTDRIKSVVTANYSPDCSRGRIFGAVKFLQSRPEILLRNHIISVSTGLALWY